MDFKIVEMNVWELFLQLCRGFRRCSWIPVPSFFNQRLRYFDDIVVFLGKPLAHGFVGSSSGTVALEYVSLFGFFHKDRFLQTPGKSDFLFD